MKKSFQKVLAFVLICSMAFFAIPAANAAVGGGTIAEPYVASTHVVVVRDALLSSNSTTSTTLTTIPAGARVALVSGTWGPTSTTLVKVTYGNYTGYITASSLCPIGSCYKVNTSAGLNLRSGPGTSYSVKCGLSYGTYLYKTSTSGSWYYVRVMSGTYTGMTGYVSSDYVTSG